MNENLKLVSHSGADLTLKQVYTDHRQIDRQIDLQTDRQGEKWTQLRKEEWLDRQPERKTDKVVSKKFGFS